MKNLKIGAALTLMLAGLAGCGPKPTIVDVQLDTTDCTLEFDHNGTFTSEGLKVIATYSDNSTAELEFSTSTPDLTTVGDGKEVVVTYTVNGEEQTLTYTVDVNATFVDVSLDAANCVTEFGKGQEFTSEGLKVYANYSDGTATEITDFTVTGPDMSVVSDEAQATVSFTFNGQPQTLHYDVDVSYWSDAELEILDDTILSYAADLPYLPGMEIIADDEGWYACLEDANADIAMDYALALEDIDTSIEHPSYGEVTFDVKGTQFAASVAQSFGLDPENTYYSVLIPSFVDSDGYDERLFVNDEYFIVGLDAETSDLIVTTAYANAILSGFFNGTDTFAFLLDNMGYAAVAINAFINKGMNQLLEVYFGECAAKFPALVCSDSDGFVGITDYLALNPFSSLQAYDLAADFVIESANAAVDVLEFEANLAELGYEDVTEDGDEGKFYELNYKYAGSFEVEVYELEDKGEVVGYQVEFFFVAPEEEHYLIEEWADLCFAGPLNYELEDFTVILDYYETQGFIVLRARENVPAGCDTGAIALGFFYLEFLSDSFAVLTAPTADTQDPDLYTMSITDGLYVAEVSCKVTDGVAAITALIYEFDPLEVISVGMTILGIPFVANQTIGYYQGIYYTVSKNLTNPEEPFAAEEIETKIVAAATAFYNNLPDCFILAGGLTQDATGAVTATFVTNGGVALQLVIEVEELPENAGYYLTGSLYSFYLA